MAVWLNTFGKKEFFSLSDKRVHCENIVKNLRLDFEFLEGTFEEKKGEPVPHFEYDLTKWILHTEANDTVWFEYPLYLYNSLKITLVHDFLQFIGPFDHFQNYSLLASDKNLREGYTKMVRTIFKSFDVSQAVYCSEWFFTNEENNYFYKDLEEQIAQYPQNRVDSLENIQDQEYYLEVFK